MVRTIYDTPFVSSFCRFISGIILLLTGWQPKGVAPTVPKSVMIAVPHTSNWDFFYLILISFRLRIKIYWMGKDSLFKGYKGIVMRWLGGVAVDRSAPNNLVDQMIAEFNRCGELNLVVPPEGTRGAVKAWKTGFYYIALGAKVPVYLGFLDYGKKVGGVGPAFYPTGDIEKDIAEIKQFYVGMKAKNTKLFSEESVRIKDQPKD